MRTGVPGPGSGQVPVRIEVSADGFRRVLIAAAASPCLGSHKARMVWKQSTTKSAL